MPAPGATAAGLLDAASRLVDGTSLAVRSGPYPLRPEQRIAFERFVEHVLEHATHPDVEREAWCRLVLPPRVGKTVLAGHMIEETGLRSVYVVPTKALIEQTRRALRALRAQLDATPVGAFFGDEKGPAEGVNLIAVRRGGPRRGSSWATPRRASASERWALSRRGGWTRPSR